MCSRLRVRRGAVSPPTSHRRDQSKRFHDSHHTTSPPRHGALRSPSRHGRGSHAERHTRDSLATSPARTSSGSSGDRGRYRDHRGGTPSQSDASQADASQCGRSTRRQGQGCHQQARGGLTPDRRSGSHDIGAQRQKCDSHRMERHLGESRSQSGSPAALGYKGGGGSIDRVRTPCCSDGPARHMSRSHSPQRMLERDSSGSRSGRTSSSSHDGGPGTSPRSGKRSRHAQLRGEGEGELSDVRGVVVSREGRVRAVRHDGKDGVEGVVGIEDGMREWEFDEELHTKLRTVPRRGRGGVGTRVFDTGTLPLALRCHTHCQVFPARPCILRSCRRIQKLAFL